MSAGFSYVDVARDVCRQSFYQFVKEFWHTVVPEKPVWNWHMELLCSELQRLAMRVFSGKPKLYDLVVNIPPGTTKPVWDQSPILMGDGSYKRLRDVRVGDLVIGKSGKPCRVSAVHVQGKLPCVRVGTWHGRRITAALDHPVLTTNGWVAAGELLPGNRLALMHRPQVLVSDTDDRRDEEFLIAGYLIGDGCTSGTNLGFTNKDPEYLREFVKCVRAMGWAYRVREVVNDRGRTGIYNVFPKNAARSARTPDRRGQFKGCGRGRHPRGGPRQWCRDVGLAGKSSKTKRVPEFVWQGTQRQIGLFLAAYFHCDGTVVTTKSGRVQISLTTISPDLAKDIQRLCLRLGISMRLRRTLAKRGFVYNRTLKGYKSYIIDTFGHDPDAVARFAEKIPLHGRKAIAETAHQRHRFEERFLPDAVKWTKDVGKLPCRCLTVEDDASFIVDGVVVHNSTITSVMFPAWCWTHMPTARFICGSYTQALAMDLSRKNRDLVQGTSYKDADGRDRPGYRAVFPNGRLALREDQNTKTHFVNAAGGLRYAVGVGGSVMGFHGHFIIIDDPLDPQQAVSDVELKIANDWMNETVPSRKVDKLVTPTILIMQRLHQNDPSGNRLDNKRAGRVRHICLPADLNEGTVKPGYLRERYSSEGLLDPHRLGRQALDEALGRLGDYGYAGQYSQNPVPRGGGAFKVDKLQYGPPPPLDHTGFKAVVRYWDKAASSKGGDYTVGVKMGLDHDGRVWVLDVRRGQWDSHTREKIIQSVAADDTVWTWIGLEEEGGSSGKDATLHGVRSLKGHRIKVIRPTGDKQVRADPFSSQVNGGNVWVAPGPWMAAYLNELRYFPMGTYDDQVDASAGAFTVLTQVSVRRGAL